jgi:hypothetical protein
LCGGGVFRYCNGRRIVSALAYALTVPEQLETWRRGQLPASPYQRGWEDYRYCGIYANPYRVESKAWEAYQRGNEDARKGVM